MSVMCSFLIVAALAGPPGALEAQDAERRAAVCQAALDLECAEAAVAPWTTLEVLAPLPPALRLALATRAAEIALALSSDAADPRLTVLLTFSPAAEGLGWPPAWRARLEAVRRALPDVLAPTLRALPAEARSGQPAMITVEVTDGGGVLSVRLFLRDPDGPARSYRLASQDGLRFLGEIPSELVVEPEVGFWVEAEDRAGNIGRLGSEASPQSLAVTAAPEPPVTETWWFWTATIGGAALLAGAGALTWYYLQVDDEAAPSAAEYGGLRVDVIWPGGPQ